MPALAAARLQRWAITLSAYQYDLIFCPTDKHGNADCLSRLTTTEKTITELRKIFATHGLPEQLVSDNGAQFTSYEFEEFLKCNGIKHIRSAPYHPATNGEAERFVQTFKHAMKIAKADEGTLETKLARFLITYRSTPNSTTSVAPAELLFHRQLRTRLNMLKPDLMVLSKLNKSTIMT